MSANGTTWTTVFDRDVSGEYGETADGKRHSSTAQDVPYVRDYLNGNTAKYYLAEGARVARRRASVIYYLLGDHLGSTPVVADASEAKVSEVRYEAYGEMRYNGTPNGTPTNYRFTGQRFDSFVK